MMQRRTVNPAVMFLACLLGFGILGVIIAFSWGTYRIHAGYVRFDAESVMNWLTLFALPLFILGGFVGLVVAVAMRLRNDRMMGRMHRF